MTVTATGVFDVQRNVLDPCDLGDGVQAMHMRFDKRFHGALDASGVVHMLAVSTPVENAASSIREKIRFMGHLLRNMGWVAPRAGEVTITARVRI